MWLTQYDLLTNAETGYAGRYGESETGATLLPPAKYDEISSLRLTSYVLMGAAVPLAATAALLWGVSDDPARYDSLVDAAAPAPPPTTTTTPPTTTSTTSTTSTMSAR